MVKILLSIILAYLGTVAVIYAVQRHLQYHPDRHPPGKPAEHGAVEMRELRVRTEDGLELLAWFAPPKHNGGKTIIFYHGNTGDIGSRVEKIRHFLDAGYGVYLCEYRGFAGNPGRISEDGFYQDARAALNWLAKHGYAPSTWVIYGESIGSGPAVQMAMEYKAKYLILDGGFSNAYDVAEGKYFWLPVSYLLKDKYDNISKIKNVHASLLMLHGDHDQVVPYPLGKKLFDAAHEPKKFVTVKGGHHSDLYDFGVARTILAWLAGQK